MDASAAGIPRRIESEEAEKRRRKLIDDHKEASTKFTNYLAGLSLAILTFGYQHFDKSPKWAQWIYVASWLLLAASLGASLRRMVLEFHLRALEARRADSGVHLETLLAAKRDGFKLVHDDMRPWTDEEYDSQLKSRKAVDGEYVKRLEKLSPKMQSTYAWSLRFLVAGLLAQGIARMAPVIIDLLK
jgi:hypothetical protein